jgi:hypothetical protein
MYACVLCVFMSMCVHEYVCVCMCVCTCVNVCVCVCRAQDSPFLSVTRISPRAQGVEVLQINENGGIIKPLDLPSGGSETVFPTLLFFFFGLCLFFKLHRREHVRNQLFWKRMQTSSSVL